MASFRGAMDATPRAFRGSWEGENKIVVGIDIGTTQSGVAFTYLQNGECGETSASNQWLYFSSTGASQVIHRVTRWPGQEAHNQKGKIPTVVWYDTDQRVHSYDGNN